MLGLLNDNEYVQPNLHERIEEPSRYGGSATQISLREGNVRDLRDTVPHS